MLKQFGRIVLNVDLVVKVLSNKKAGTTTVYLSGGAMCVFKKHAAAVWTYFKGESD